MISTPDRLRVLWLIAGWCGVALVSGYSLVPDPPDLGISQGDKLQHLGAYGGLMLWFSQVYTHRSERRRAAFLLVGMGIALEFAQALTGYREPSAADAAANAAGVAVGWLAAPPRLPNALHLAQSVLNRFR
ncbi:MAG: VanZ family protein [Betaproteobacteria bacterium]|jgi:VanZ family protein